MKQIGGKEMTNTTINTQLEKWGKGVLRVLKKEEKRREGTRSRDEGRKGEEPPR